MTSRRVRQHVNPFTFRIDPPRPDWTAVFASPGLPLEVEIGCALGGVLVARARTAPSVNVVGLEIRGPVVERAARRVAEAGLRNAHVIHCHANRSFASLFDEASVARVYVHFPDPWFKTRHQKRRLITPDLLDVLATRMRPGAELHFTTDHADYAARARALVEAHPAFLNVHGAGAGAPGPLLELLSDREARQVARGLPVHRHLFARR